MVEAPIIKKREHCSNYRTDTKVCVLIDRTYCLRYPQFRLANKVGGLVVVAGRRGLANAAMSIQTYFLGNHMVVADYVAGLASEKGAIKKDKYAMKEAWEVGNG